MGVSRNSPLSRSWGVAFCGMVTALAQVILLLGGVIPAAMFIAPAVAGLLVLVVREECGLRLAATCYLAIGLLGLLFLPDKEVVGFFVVLLGYYPLVKQRLDAIRLPALRLAAKLLLCDGSILAMYGMVLILFPMAPLSGELRETALWMTLLTLIIGDVAFLLLDRAIHRLLLAYQLVWGPRLHQTLKHH